MRRKRNSSVYDTAESITESEVAFALREAEDLVEKILPLLTNPETRLLFLRRATI